MGAAALAIIAFVAAAHMWELEGVPHGLFGDEASIGLNALSIAQSGRDDNGQRWPLYFRSWGDYKSPLYIYSVAAVFLVAKASDFWLRFTSFLYFSVYLASIYLLLGRLFPATRLTRLFGLLAAGLLPWHFVLSRIAFESNSQLALTGVVSLLVWETFHGESRVPRVLAAVTGAALGLSLYSYPTSRLLAALFLTVIVVCYYDRSTRTRLAILVGVASVAAVPMLVYMIEHAGTVDHRFRSLTFLFDQNLSVLYRARRSVEGVLVHFDPRFLLLHGDANRRHATGAGGEIFISVAILVAVALLANARGLVARCDRFFLYLVLCCLASPVAAALTIGLPHAIRSQLLGYFLVMLSAYGFAAIESLPRPALRASGMACMLALLVIEAGVFVGDYFGRYAGTTGDLFWNYGAREAFAAAVRRQPESVGVSAGLRDYTVRWNLATMQGGERLTVRFGDVLPRPGSCVVFRWRDPADDRLVTHDLAEMARSNLEFVDDSLPGALIGVRCYAPLRPAEVPAQ